jgi:hypothetical protein
MITDGIWLTTAEQMYDDGVITYSAPRGNYRKVFKRLERKTGLNFERVNKREDPEIDCAYTDDNGYWWGLARVRRGGFDLYTVESRRGSRTEAHEIGHALGLDHTSNPRSALSPDYQKEFLSGYDNAHIIEVFNL